MTDWYVKTGNPSTRASGLSAVMRAEFALIEAAFAKLPTYTGNALYPVRVNSGGTGLEAVAPSTLAASLLSEAVAFTGDITPSQITANQNDYNPTGLSTASVLRLSTDASRNITGLQGGSDGRVVMLENVGSFDFVLKDSDAGSSAANRFALDADITVRPDWCVMLKYDSTASRWRMIGSQNVAQATGSLTEDTAPDLIADFLHAYDTSAGVEVKIKISTLLPPGVLVDYAGTVVPTGYLACDGANVSRATYPRLFAALVRSATVTFDNTTDKVAWTAHGLSNGDLFKFTTTGGAPTGLTAGTTYYVVSATTNDFQIAATEGGSAINFTTDGTGVHTGIHAPFGDGDGSTTFGLPDSRRRATVGRGGTATATLGARLGASGGAETHALTAGEGPAHQHTGTTGTESADHTHATYTHNGFSSATTASAATPASNGDSAYFDGNTGGRSAAHTHSFTSDSAGSGTAHNNVQPSLVVTKLIKY